LTYRHSWLQVKVIRVKTIVWRLPMDLYWACSGYHMESETWKTRHVVRLFSCSMACLIHQLRGWWTWQTRVLVCSWAFVSNTFVLQRFSWL